MFRSRGRSGSHRVFPRQVLAAGALLFAFWAASSDAAEPVFPPGSRLGLSPPGQMQPSRAFQGFEDRERNGAILFVEFPAVAYAEFEKMMTNDALGKQGLVIEKREPFTIGKGKAVLVTGRQEASGVKLRKWLLLASLTDMTALVTVQIPESSAKSYPADAIKAALASLSVRPTPIGEQMDLLSFRFEDMAGFRVARVTPPNAVLLTDGRLDDFDGAKQSHFVVAVGPGGPEQPGDRGEFARQAMTAMPGFKEMKLTSAEPIRLGGQQGYEVRADAKNAKTDNPVAIVQWVRFGSSGFLRLVGVAPKDSWEEVFPRFRTLRDGVAPR